MDYRTPAAEPLLAALGSLLVALHPEQGNVLWSVPTEFAISRIFRVGARALAVSGQQVFCVDFESGRTIGVIDLGFAPDTGIVCGDSLVLARAGMIIGGHQAIVCLTADGQTKWRGEVHDDTLRLLRMFGPQNEPRGEARGGLLKGHAGFAYRDAVVQPDRN